MTFEPAAPPHLVDIDNVLAARHLLKGVIRRTPVAESWYLSERVGAQVVLKCEHLQRTGSFKLRGAYVRIARLAQHERQRGVVAASAGNHGQGVALASALLGVEATVFMPRHASLPKIQATRAYGADVKLSGPDVESAVRAAQEYSRTTGAVFIHPYDHPDIVAGQATVALEIVEQVPDLRSVVVPIGGGGLAAGLAVVLRETQCDVKIIGVQSEHAHSFGASLGAGTPQTVRTEATLADGIAVARPGDLPFALIQESGSEVVTVSDAAISQAILLLAERSKMIVEPAGAVTIAALLEHPGLEGTIVPVLSGGNIDPLLLMQVLRHGLAADQRFQTVRMRVSDHPGALSDILQHLARMDVNVLDITHERLSGELAVGETSVVLQLETRGSEHQREVSQWFESYEQAGSARV